MILLMSIFIGMVQLNPPNPTGERLLCIQNAAKDLQCITEDQFFAFHEHSGSKVPADALRDVLARYRGNSDARSHVLLVSGDKRSFGLAELPRVLNVVPKANSPVRTYGPAVSVSPLDIAINTEVMGGAEATLRYGPPTGIGGAMCHTFHSVDECRGCCADKEARNTGILGGISLACHAGTIWNPFGEVFCFVYDAVVLVAVYEMHKDCNNNCMIVYNDEDVMMPNGMTYRQIVSQPPKRGFIRVFDSDHIYLDETVRKTVIAGDNKALAYRNNALIQIASADWNDRTYVINDYSVVPRQMNCHDMEHYSTWIGYVHRGGCWGPASLYPKDYHIRTTEGWCILVEKDWRNLDMSQYVDKTVLYWGFFVCDVTQNAAIHLQGILPIYTGFTP